MIFPVILLSLVPEAIDISSLERKTREVTSQRVINYTEQIKEFLAKDGQCLRAR